LMTITKEDIDDAKNNDEKLTKSLQLRRKQEEAAKRAIAELEDLSAQIMNKND